MNDTTTPEPTGDVWAGPFTVANEPAGSPFERLVQVCDMLGQPYCYVDRADCRDDWSKATQRARHLTNLLNAQQLGPFTPADTLAKDVTRFLTHPGLRVAHPVLDMDLQVTGTDAGRDGLVCDLVAEDGSRWRYPLAELVPAGAANDAVRDAVRMVSKAVMEDTLARMIGQGALFQPLDYGALLEPVAYLRQLPGTETLDTCHAGDPGAFPVFGQRPVDVEADAAARRHDQADHKGSGADWCHGCTIRERDRINLPDNWAVGDPVPDGLTIHRTVAEDKPWGPGPFAFRGHPSKQDRVYLDTMELPTPEVHDLQAHAEYVMEPTGAHAEPVIMVCPDCNHPLTHCLCL